MKTTSDSDLRQVTILAAAIATLLVCAPAHAMSTASASLGPLGITLYDLNPDDGIVPSISFYYDLPYDSSASVSAEDAYNGQSSSVVANGSGRWAPVAATTSGVANASASASVSGTGSAVDTVFAASGTALGTNKSNPIDSAGSQFAGYATAPHYQYAAFSLSAYTQVDFSASFVANASVTRWWDPATSYEVEYAFARGQLFVFDSRSGSGEVADAVAGSQIYDTSPPCPSMVSGYCWGPDSSSVSRTLSASLVNDTDASLDGYMENYVQVYGYSYATAAVPEPATAALVLAGLAATAFARKRRARRSV
ncbi:MAG TPA: PEP-CTERM sorting domain-containing protein [Burkholderiaceae bacterium]|nr:PEP-CTERM sorting domain-containing protein [Burkholderiaceae bacterium]